MRLMGRKSTNFDGLNRALRCCLVLLMLLALNIPHLGMAAGMPDPAVSMVHAGPTHDRMAGAGNSHEKMGGALCATLCLGTDKPETPAFAQWVLRSGLVPWYGDIERAWPSFAPDAALRPPDPLHQI